MLRYLYVVDVLCESIYRPFVLSVKRGKVEFIDRIAVVLDIVPGYYWVVAVDPD